jgi:hypothetical protein
MEIVITRKTFRGIGDASIEVQINTLKKKRKRYSIDSAQSL